MSNPPSVSIFDLYNLNRDVHSDGLRRLAEKHGEIYALLPASVVTPIAPQTYVVNSYQLAQELLGNENQQALPKAVAGPLEFIRKYLTGDALITALESEHEAWDKAHKILLRVFRQPKLGQSTFSVMNDIIGQLLLKWERFGPLSEVDVSEDFSRLTLDILALSAMGVRFNSFYDSKPHPFANAMEDFLEESVKSSMVAEAGRASWGATLDEGGITKEACISNAKFIRDYFKQAIQTRSGKTEASDFLSNTLQNKQLDADDVSKQLAAIFVAAIGPTSGLLSFVMYELVKNPEVRKKVQEEIRIVLGGGACTLDQLAKLPYITNVLKETLRLHPPVPAHALQTNESKVIAGGKYVLAGGSRILIHDRLIQRDPAVWGPDANEFNPDRMHNIQTGTNGMSADKKFKPFGNGSRACLGHEFAIQLAKLVVVLLFRHFDFELVNPNYELKHKQRVALQPDGLKVFAKLRKEPEGPGAVITFPPPTPGAPSVQPPSKIEELPPVYIFWGGNNGTCETYALTLSRWAPAKGFKPIMADLDQYQGDKFPKDGPVIIIAATFTGMSPVSRDKLGMLTERYQAFRLIMPESSSNG
ncbi:hypothetical protein FRC07_006221 [Ceratobasidium sp. 392]|nr:hypothetical protein FRC07_006221 [Ceratobasidium sp. 392]